jgi:hypothetical protein
MNRTLFLAAAVALAACAPEFDPASSVDRLRVLAIRADPPEIAPPPAAGAPVAPDRAALTSFVLRADFATAPARQTTVLYLACVPVAGDPAPSPCVALAGLRDPTGVLAEAAQASCRGHGDGDGTPPPIVLAGVEVCEAGACGSATATIAGVLTPLPPAGLAIPPGYGFDALPAGAPERILGVQAEVLAFALDASPDELAAGAGGACPLGDVAAGLSRLWGTREHVLAAKRVRIRGPEAPDPPNRNPVIEGIAADGTPLAASAPTALAAGTLQLRPVLPSDADTLRETYTKLDAAGTPIERGQEDWVYSWFSTAGELEELHTREPTPDEWTVGAGGARASGGRVLVAAVLRDLRGGTAWTWREVTLAPAP